MLSNRNKSQLSEFNKKYVFGIPISFKELSIGEFLPLDRIESGN
jgi:hypothetical protein